MRILSTADLHYRLPQYDWLVDQAPDFDVVALPGDHIDLASAVPMEAQVVVLRTYFQKLASDTLVMTTSGNHDLDGPGDDGEQIPRWLRHCGEDRLHVDGETVDVGSTRFSLFPWWDGPMTKKQVDAHLDRDGIDRAETWIWLYHSPPAGTGLCRSGKRDYPDPDLADWIEQWQPDFVFTGHIHNAPWVEGGAWAAKIGRTWVFNAGRTSGPIPAHVIVDTETATASWFGPPDRGEIALDR